MTAEDPLQWPDIQPQLNRLSQAELIDLLRELFEYSGENRMLLRLRMPATSGGDALAAYQQQVREVTFPANLHDFPNISRARQLIHSYRQATGDLAGTIELLLTCLEAGTAGSNELGGIDAAFYADLETVLDDLVTLFEAPAVQSSYLQHAQRLQNLARASSNIGWGYGAYVPDQIETLLSQMGIEPESDADQVPLINHSIP